MNQIKSIFLMLIATIFWGTAFSVQSRGMQFVGPILFVMLRSLVTLTALSIIIIIADSIRNKKFSLISNNISGANCKILLYGGFWCGLALALASIFQQYGLLSAKVGFFSNVKHHFFSGLPRYLRCSALICCAAGFPV